MERKTKHRILGIFVVIGFIVLLLPFLQGGRELPSEATLVKAPPFPDQSVQPGSTPSTSAQESSPQETVSLQQSNLLSPTDENKSPLDDTIKMTQAALPNTEAAQIARSNAEDPASANITETSANNAPKKMATDIWTEEESQSKQPPATESVASATEVETIPAETAPKMAANDKAIMTESDLVKKPEEATEVEVIKEEPAVKLTQQTAAEPVTVKKPIKTNKQTLAAKIKSQPIKGPIVNNGLADLKSASWVIQVGSFKNKTNALRLVNQLRANGYRAFIQQISGPIGNSTRVFVGPEGKQVTARALATRLENEMRIRGIVLSYKPLAL